MKKTYMAPDTQVCEMEFENLICISGDGALSISGGGSTDEIPGSGDITIGIKRRNVEELEDLW